MNIMQKALLKPRWSPYLVGAALGVLSWITFGLMNKALGVSTTFVRVAGLIEAIFAPEHVAGNEYFTKYIIKKPAIDWQLMLVLGIFIGVIISKRLSRTTFTEYVPDLWKWRFGPSRWTRCLVAFLGGVLVLFGSRLAGGCTSGHGLSGTMQLAIGSWVFFPALFLGGVVTAFILFGRKGRDHV